MTGFSRHIKKMAAAVVLVSTLAMSSSNAQTSTVGPRREASERIDAHLKELEKSGFSGAVLILQGGEIVLRKGYGFADKERKVVPTADMVIPIGDLSSLFTAAAIYKLEGESKLSMTDMTIKFFDPVPFDKDDLEIEQLLRHYSGLPPQVGPATEFPSKDDAVKAIFDAKFIAERGMKRTPSASGYVLLAAIIEKITKTPFEQYLQENIFKPGAAMKTGSSLPRWNKDQFVEGFKGTTPKGTGHDAIRGDGPSWNVRGGDGILSTLEDLETWWSMLLAGRILPKAQQETFVNGLAKKTKRDTLMINVAGSSGPFSVLYIRWLDEKASLALFTNNEDWPQIKVSQFLMDEVKRLITPFSPKDSESP